ncbi:MAG: hypothetical protein D3913_15550 [Candidatus Electrothrix sp. LOE1_4_5]|nr:hypothetical protein [Candidatus Electrothrix gigas]
MLIEIFFCCFGFNGYTCNLTLVLRCLFIAPHDTKVGLFQATSLLFGIKRFTVCLFVRVFLKANSIN